MQDRKYVIKSLNSSENDRIEFMSLNMSNNGAYKFNEGLKREDNIEELEKLKKKYLDYRINWREQPKKIINSKNLVKKNFIPLCIDIEVAAVCDLGCPHCYRQFIATPDKIMNSDLVYKIIDQASELGVPSMKFNWRGEPLLHPELYKHIRYAKKKGILETIINTNATMLDEKYSLRLIDSGLDILIYSFDGGTKETYEKMRPGRFKVNKFEDIYENIKNFNKIRKLKNSVFPRTKIQMVLTDETHNEISEFKRLFKDVVDDVSLKQYTERGGAFDDLGKELQDKIVKKNIDQTDLNKYIFMRDVDGEIYKSKKRLPCEQPFQRMLITYDGTVSMCCYDWGSMHPVGYVSELSFVNETGDLEEVMKKSKAKKKGFEMMNLSMPQKFNYPEKKVESIKEIWLGKEINKVRNAHKKNKIETVEICKKCPFKETYDWQKA
jgi:MoaA/NifB/PqqE/SkfB family radical SAM enzyme